ncbi:MAG: C40 family peptidase [Candidatus Cloacimonetes bacterium]|nr:C40 family peptidase [Candidatus Cloacimonadota bacterium]
MYPIRNTAIRLALIFGFIVVATQFFVKIKDVNTKLFKWLVSFLVFIFILGVLNSTKLNDISDFSTTYISKLTSYHDIKYVWGGENKRGIDCSGLMRMALVDTLITHGLLDRNLYLIWKAFNLWYYDLSAKAIMHGYDGKTFKVFDSLSIKDIDHSKLSIGDMAATDNGVHVLAYIGDKKWIQADPTRGKVTIDHSSSKAPWLDTKVCIVRWKLISDKISKLKDK